MSTDTQPAATQEAPATPDTQQSGPTLGDRAKALLSRTAKARPAPAHAPVPVPAKQPARPAKGAKMSEPTAPEGPALAQEDIELLRQYREDKARAATAQRVEYARRAGLQQGIDDATAAAMVAQFDVSTTEGRNKFEAWRKANPGLFVARRNAAEEAAGLAKKYAPKEGAADRKIFGAKYAQRQIERNLGRGGRS